jgi:hypothetical protein
MALLVKTCKHQLLEDMHRYTCPYDGSEVLFQGREELAIPTVARVFTTIHEMT